MLLSVSTLRSDYLDGVADTSEKVTSILGRALQRAEDYAAVFLGYPGEVPTLASQSYTLRLQALRNTDRELWVPLAPITTLTSIHQDERLLFGASSLVPSADYELVSLRQGTKIRLLPEGSTASWSATEASIQLVATAGYANEAALPTPLADALYQHVANWWLRRANRHLQFTRQTNAGQTYTSLPELEAHIKGLLAPYALLGNLGVS